LYLIKLLKNNNNMMCKNYGFWLIVCVTFFSTICLPSLNSKKILKYLLELK
jgi:hypothetical protein